MLLNLSNHPSANWSDTQRHVAESLYGGIIDLHFPAVDPSGDETYIMKLAADYETTISEYAARHSNIVVHIMGEMTFTYALISLLKEIGIECIASTSARIVKEFPDGRKEASFVFERFRKY